MCCLLYVQNYVSTVHIITKKKWEMFSCFLNYFLLLQYSLHSLLIILLYFSLWLDFHCCGFAACICTGSAAHWFESATFPTEKGAYTIFKMRHREIFLRFPHLQMRCGFRCIRVSLRMNGSPVCLYRAACFDCGWLRVLEQLWFLHSHNHPQQCEQA